VTVSRCTWVIWLPHCPSHVVPAPLYPLQDFKALYKYCIIIIIIIDPERWMVQDLCVGGYHSRRIIHWISSFHIHGLTPEDRAVAPVLLCLLTCFPGEPLLVDFSQFLHWLVLWFAFSALTLLVERQEEHPAYNKLSCEVLAWLSVCSEVQMICIWSSWCHCHPIISCFITTPIHLASLPRLSWKRDH